MFFTSIASIARADGAGCNGAGFGDQLDQGRGVRGARQGGGGSRKELFGGGKRGKQVAHGRMDLKGDEGQERDKSKKESLSTEGDTRGQEIR